MQFHDSVDAQAQRFPTNFQGSNQDASEKAQKRENDLPQSHNIFGLYRAFVQKGSFLLPLPNRLTQAKLPNGSWVG